MTKNKLINLIEIKRYCSPSYSQYGIQLIVNNTLDCIIYFDRKTNTISLKEHEHEYVMSFYISEGFFEELSAKRLLREILLKMNITMSLQDELIKDNKYDFYKNTFTSVLESISNINEISMKSINFDSYFNFVLYDFKYNYLFFKNEFLQDENLQSLEIYDKLNKTSLNKTLYTKKEKTLNILFLELYKAIENENDEFIINNETINNLINENIIELIYHFDI